LPIPTCHANHRGWARLTPGFGAPGEPGSPGRESTSVRKPAGEGIGSLRNLRPCGNARYLTFRMLHPLCYLLSLEHNISEQSDGKDNADAHLRRQVMGREVVVAVTNGRLDFGTWERIFYGEFDSRRRKRVLVKTIGE
jgi:hypothetical protein